MPELPLGPNEFVQGRMFYGDFWEDETYAKIVVTITYDNLIITSAILDTGAPWSVLNPAEFQVLAGQYDPSLAAHDFLNIRGQKYRGHIWRIPATLEAGRGTGITIEASVFVPELADGEIWPHPNFIGLEGFLNRIRFAIDPEHNYFYFGSDQDLG
ncbi:MAG: hypothetical protein K8L91_01475 [Anaerolineae bacterium]|nr:hypothetical protein [Anaerolineae bacterium]